MTNEEAMAVVLSRHRTTAERRIIAIIESHTDIRPVTLDLTAAELSSLSFMSIIHEVECEFRVITNEEYAGLRCVGDLCRLFSGAHEEVRVV
jgi:acyl carrier protein